MTHSPLSNFKISNVLQLHAPNCSFILIRELIINYVKMEAIMMDKTADVIKLFLMINNYR